MSTETRVVSIYFALSGLSLLAIGIIIALSWLPSPISVTSIPLGMVGLAATGAFATLPVVVGILFLFIAAGLWKNKAWAAWVAIVFSAIGLLLTVLVAIVAFSIPAIQYFQAIPCFPAQGVCQQGIGQPTISAFLTSLPFIAIGAAINVGVIVSLSVPLHRGELE